MTMPDKEVMRRRIAELEARLEAVNMPAAGKRGPFYDLGVQEGMAKGEKLGAAKERAAVLHYLTGTRADWEAGWTDDIRLGKHMTDEAFIAWCEKNKPCRYCEELFVGPVCPCELPG